MHATRIARQLRRNQTPQEKELWRAVKAGRFAGFKFRRQHPTGHYVLDCYCPMARLAVELDGFRHGSPECIRHDQNREKFLGEQDIEVLRFWNHQWEKNREGVLLEIWQALHRRTGCVKLMRKAQNNRFTPPKPDELISVTKSGPTKKPVPPRPIPSTTSFR